MLLLLLLLLLLLNWYSFSWDSKCLIPKILSVADFWRFWRRLTFIHMREYEMCENDIESSQRQTTQHCWVSNTISTNHALYRKVIVTICFYFIFAHKFKIVRTTIFSYNTSLKLKWYFLEGFFSSIVQPNPINRIFAIHQF